MLSNSDDLLIARGHISAIPVYLLRDILTKDSVLTAGTRYKHYPSSSTSSRIGFKTITEVSAAESGIRTIPLMVVSVIGLMVGAILATIGAGLISTWQINLPKAIWIGYQVINGTGLGLVYQVPNLAIQTVLPKKDAPPGFTMALFDSLLLSSVFISIGENVQVNQLVIRLSKLTDSPVNASIIYASDAATLLNQLPED
ncbi:hypothetical protein EMCG_00039 [[Emmonsia] crescens]|uniref:Uncharacterized protein n=1 Tax=[Emmonsia] crescens TaxID=73230 RepID=A0A0G2IE60_9EURO|nr:hypothetical protein EMCG_00039 [Emmonsia crescens UAMH 3008]